MQGLAGHAVGGRLGAQELAAAVRVGRLTKIADGVVLGADAVIHILRQEGESDADQKAEVFSESHLECSFDENMILIGGSIKVAGC